jgi:hypothetical protein
VIGTNHRLVRIDAIYEIIMGIHRRSRPVAAVAGPRVGRSDDVRSPVDATGMLHNRRSNRSRQDLRVAKYRFRLIVYHASDSRSGTTSPLNSHNRWQPVTASPARTEWRRCRGPSQAAMGPGVLVERAHDRVDVADCAPDWLRPSEAQRARLPSVTLRALTSEARQLMVARSG